MYTHYRIHFSCVSDPVLKVYRNYYLTRIFSPSTFSPSQMDKKKGSSHNEEMILKKYAMRKDDTCLTPAVTCPGWSLLQACFQCHFFLFFSFSFSRVIEGRGEGIGNRWPFRLSIHCLRWMSGREKGSKAEKRWGHVGEKVQKQCVHFLSSLLQAVDFHHS